LRSCGRIVQRPPADKSHVFVLNDVVTGIEDLLIRLIGENIVLSTVLAVDLGQVKMDPAQVQQILLNLVLNARDAMPDGGRITVSTRNRSDPVPIGRGSESQILYWVELTVADTGDGMDAETLDRAFEGPVIHVADLPSAIQGQICGFLKCGGKLRPKNRHRPVSRRAHGACRTGFLAEIPTHFYRIVLAGLRESMKRAASKVFRNVHVA